jgi:catechol 2,3-dioxygenase-like lactoylglutathione lyase family enzyme
METKFDHIVIGVADLDIAVNDYRQQGFTVIYGGEHASATTHNALVVLRDSSYIELMAKTGKDPKPGADSMDFEPLLDNMPGYVAYAFYVDDIDAAVSAMCERGVTVDDPQTGKRTRKDGVELRWKLVKLTLGAMTLILISDETDRALRIPAEADNIYHDNSVLNVRSLVHVAADPPAFAARLQAIFGVEPNTKDDQLTLTVGDVNMTFVQPQTETLQTYHTENGDCVWRLILSGVGEMYKRLDTTKLHEAQMIIVGENA